MDERTWLAERFEEKRGHLRAVAYRMLGSDGEAEDAVQEAWLRLETLAPAERVAFVLHDMFDLTFDEIAPIVGRSTVAARQLASRARRRVQHAGSASEGDRQRQREMVEAFLAASRGGDFEALLTLLDPDVVLRADAVAVQASVSNRAEGAPELEPTARGAAVVAGTFSGRARAAEVVLIDGAPGAVWAPDGRPRAAFIFTLAAGKIVAIELIADPGRLRQLDVVFLNR